MLVLIIASALKAPAAITLLKQLIRLVLIVLKYAIEG